MLAVCEKTLLLVLLALLLACPPERKLRQSLGEIMNLVQLGSVIFFSRKNKNKTVTTRGQMNCWYVSTSHSLNHRTETYVGLQKLILRPIKRMWNFKRTRLLYARTHIHTHNWDIILLAKAKHISLSNYETSCVCAIFPRSLRSVLNIAGAKKRIKNQMK